MATAHLKALVDDTTYREAVARGNDFRSELNSVERSISELQTATSGDGQRSSVAREAEALVTGEDDADVGREQLATLRRREQVLREAIRLQSQVVSRERNRVSRLICEQKLPEYRTLIKRGAKALSDLKQYMSDERAFRESLVAADINFVSVLRPMPVAGFTEDACDAWVSECKEYGLI